MTMFITKLVVAWAVMAAATTGNNKSTYLESTIKMTRLTFQWTYVTAVNCFLN